MSITMFNKIHFEIECPDPKCGHLIKEVLSYFHGVDRLACPNCGFLIDLHIDRFATPLGKLFETAAQVDDNTRQSGDIVERI